MSEEALLDLEAKVQQLRADYRQLEDLYEEISRDIQNLYEAIHDLTQAPEGAIQ